LSTVQVGQLHDAVLQLAKDTGAPIAQIAGAFEHARNVTGDYAASLAIATIATESAVSTGADATIVTNLLAGTMHEYGLDVSTATTEQGKFNDIQAKANIVMGAMHLATQEANTQLGPFTEATAKAVGIAANLGISYTDVYAATAALTRHGFPDVTQAGVQVTDMLTHMLNPSAGAKKALDALAVTTGDAGVAHAFDIANLQTRGLVGTIDYLKAAMDHANLSADEQEKIMMQLIPALRGGVGAAALLGTGNVDLNKTYADLNDTTKTTGVTQEALARTLGTVGGQWNLLKANLQTSAIELGEHLLPALTGLVTWLTASAVPAFRAFSDVVGGLFTDLHNGIAPLDVLGGALLHLGAPMQTVTALVSGLETTLGRIGAFIQTSVVPAWRHLTDAFGQLGSGNLKAGVEGIVTTLSGAAVQFAAQVGQWARAFLGWVEPLIPPLLSALGGLLADLGGWIQGTAAPAIGAQLGSWGQALVAWVGPRIGPLLSELGSLLAQLGGWIAGTALPAIHGQLQVWGAELALWVTYSLPPLLANLGALLSQLGGWIQGTALPAIGARLGEWASAFGSWVQAAWPMLLERLGELLERLGAWTSTALPAIAARIGSWAKALGDWVPEGLPLLLGNLAAMLGRMIGWMLDTGLPAIIESLVTWGAAFVGWIVPMLPGLLLELLKISAGIIIWIVETGATIAVQLFKWAAAFVEWVLPLIPPLLGDLAQVAGAILGWIWEQAVKAGAAALAIGAHIVEGIKQGIANKLGDLKNAGGSAAQSTLDGANATLVIGSPSKAFEQVGQQIGAGMQGGLLGSIPVVSAAATALAGTVLGAAQTYQHAMDALDLSTQAKVIDIGVKVGAALNTAIVQAAGAIRAAQQAAADAIDQAVGNLALTRSDRARSQAFGAGQSAAQVAYDDAKAQAALEYQLQADLEDAKTKAEADAIRARYDKAVEALHHQEDVAVQDRAFAASQAVAAQAFNDTLADEALQRTIARDLQARDRTIDTVNQTLVAKEQLIEQQAQTERAALAASFTAQAASLKTQFLDTLPALTAQAQGIVTAFLAAVGQQAATVAGQIVTEMANAAAAIAGLGGVRAPQLPAFGGDTWAMASGRPSGVAGQTVGQLFTGTYAPKGLNPAAVWAQQNAAAVGHNAGGTDDWSGGATWVGERGPELVNLPMGSQVIPNHHLGGGVDIPALALAIGQAVAAALQASPPIIKMDGRQVSEQVREQFLIRQKSLTTLGFK